MSPSKENCVRSFRGPIAEFRLLDESTLLIQYDSFFCGSPTFLEHAEVMKDFLDSEDLAGIADLQDLHMEEGQIIYDLETTHSLSELLARSQQPFSARAAIELFIKCAETLNMASYVAQISGIDNHKSLSFDTIWVNEEGVVQIINYGMPQLDLLAYQNGDIAEPSTASCLFAPPERLGFGQEDAASDVFSLGLLLFTLVTRENLYQGTPEEIITQAKSGMPFKNILQYSFDEILLPIFQKALHPNPYERFMDLDSFQDALKETNPSSLFGASLQEQIKLFFAQDAGSISSAPSFEAPSKEVLSAQKDEPQEEEHLQEEHPPQTEEELEQEAEERLKRLEEEEKQLQLQMEAQRQKEIEEEERLQAERLKRLEEEEKQLQLQMERERQKLLEEEQKIRLQMEAQRQKEIEEEEKAQQERLRQLEEEEARLRRETEQAKQTPPPINEVPIPSQPSQEETTPIKSDFIWLEEARQISEELRQKIDFFSQDFKKDRSFILNCSAIEVDILQYPMETGEEWHKRLITLQNSFEQEIQQAQEREEEQKRLAEEEEQRKQQQEEEERKRQEEQQKSSNAALSFAQEIRNAQQQYLQDREYQRALALLDVDRFQLDNETPQEWFDRIQSLQERCALLQQEAQSRQEEEKALKDMDAVYRAFKKELEGQTLADEQLSSLISTALSTIALKDKENASQWKSRLETLQQEYEQCVQDAQKRIEQKKKEEAEREATKAYAEGFCSGLQELLAKFPSDDDFARSIERLRSEAQEPRGATTAWWRDRISDLEQERDALISQATIRAENEKKRLAALAVVKEQSEILIIKLNAFSKRFPDDSQFQDAIQQLITKANTQPYEAQEWTANLNYVEKDLEAHLEEAQERAVQKKKREEEEKQEAERISKAQKLADDFIHNAQSLQKTYPQDAELIKNLNSYMMDAKQKSGETGASWLARVSTLPPLYEEEKVQAAERHKKAEEKRLEEERQRKIEEERRRIEEEKKELEERRRKIAEERERIEEERKRREEEKARLEKKRILREEHAVLLGAAQKYKRTHENDPITTKELEDCIEKYGVLPDEEPELLEQQLSTWKELLASIQQSYQERKAEKERREAEEKRTQALLESIEELKQLYTDQLRNLDHFCFVDPQSQTARDELALLFSQEAEESLEAWQMRLETFPLRYEALTKESEERAAQRKEEEEKKRKEEEEKKQKEEEEKKRKEEEEKKQKEEEERKQLLEKKPSDLGQALSIVHKLYNLEKEDSERELRKYLKTKLSDIKGWQIALLEDLCFYSPCLGRLKDNDSESIRTYIKEQSQNYNEEQLKSMLLLLCSVLNYPQPEFEDVPETVVAPIRTTMKVAIPLWPHTESWMGPNQTPTQTSGAIAAFQKAQKYALYRNEKARPLPFRADPSLSSASVIGYLFSQQLLPIRMDLHGQIIGWYRFQKGEETLSGMTPMSSFSSHEPLRIGFVPNQAIRIILSIPEHNIHTETIVGTTVPILSLIEIFTSRFHIPYTKWNVKVNDQVLDYYHIIHDISPTDKPVLTLSS